MVKALVEFEYDADQPDELTIRKGDIILNVKKQDGGWWEGTLNGKTGVFPDNFVKEIPEDLPKKAAPATPAADTKVEPRIAPAGADIAKKVNVNVKALMVGAQPPAIARKAVPKTKRARVTFAYAPEQSDEVELRMGDVVEIVKQEEEGWWEGIVNGKQGLFPSNFVEIIDEVSSDNGLETESAKADNTSADAGAKKLPVMGYGDIFKSGQIQLKPPKEVPVKPTTKELPSVSGQSSAAGASTIQIGGGTAKAPNVPPVVPPGAQSLPSSSSFHLALPDTSAKRRERAKVLYSYHAENEDELTLDEGAIVTVIDRNLEDPGWWKGELNGKIGVFPDNFVNVLPPEEAPPIKAKKQPLPEPSRSTDQIVGDVGGGRAVPPRPVKPTPALPQKTEANSPWPEGIHKRDSLMEKTPAAGGVAQPVLPVKPGSTSLDKRAVPQLPGSVAVKPQESVVPPLPAASSRPVPDLKPIVPATAAIDDLDGIQGTPTLNSVTASRAKNPNKRLPGAVAMPATAPPPAARRDDNGAGPAAGLTRENASVDAVPRASGGLQPQAVSADTSRLLDDLRREVAELKGAAQRQSELEREVKAVREHVDATRKDLLQRLNDVLHEVDEEKKIRLATQVEMERIKKLSMAMQAQPPR